MVWLGQQSSWHELHIYCVDELEGGMECRCTWN